MAIIDHDSDLDRGVIRSHPPEKVWQAQCSEGVRNPHPDQPDWCPAGAELLSHGLGCADDTLRVDQQGLTAPTDIKISSLADLSGKRVGVAREAAYANILARPASRVSSSSSSATTAPPSTPWSLARSMRSAR